MTEAVVESQDLNQNDEDDEKKPYVIPLNELIAVLTDVDSKVNEGIVVIDRDLNVLWVNRFHEEKGFFLEQVRGYKFYKVFEELNKPRENSPTVGSFKDGKRHMIIKDGQDGRKYKVTTTPIKNTDDEVVYVVEHTDDVTDKDIHKIELEKQRHYEKIEEAVAGARTVLVNISEKNYFHDCIDFLLYLTEKKGKNVILVTFDTDSRDLIETIVFVEKADTSRINIIDAVSIWLGTGTPPVQRLIAIHKPDSFTDIEIYTNLQLKNLDYKDVYIVFYALNNLLNYQDLNEMGIFMEVFSRSMLEYNIPILTLLPLKPNRSVNSVLATYAEKTIDFEY